MPRYISFSLFAIILLITCSIVRPADAAVVLAEDTCEVPFVLSVPAELVRANDGLGVVVHDDEAGQRSSSTSA